MKRICVSCKTLFETARHVPDQKYCSNRSCQKVRKLAWAREKLKVDPDYQQNQKVAQKTWRSSNPEYWRNYRTKKSECSDMEGSTLLKAGASKKYTSQIAQALSGRYDLKFIRQIGRVNSDVYLVEITRIRTSIDLCSEDKQMT